MVPGAVEDITTLNGLPPPSPRSSSESAAWVPDAEGVAVTAVTEVAKPDHEAAVAVAVGVPVASTSSPLMSGVALPVAVARVSSSSSSSSELESESLLASPVRVALDGLESSVLEASVLLVVGAAATGLLLWRLLLLSSGACSWAAVVCLGCVSAALLVLVGVVTVVAGVVAGVGSGWTWFAWFPPSVDVGCGGGGVSGVGDGGSSATVVASGAGCSAEDWVASATGTIAAASEVELGS